MADPMDEYSELSLAATPGARKLLNLLADLQSDPADGLIYQYARQLLLDFLNEQTAIERSCASLLRTLLQTVASLVPASDPARAQIDLAQRQLTLPLLAGELEVIKRFSERWGEQVKPLARGKAADPLPNEAPAGKIAGFAKPVPGYPVLPSSEELAPDSERLPSDERGKDFQQLQSTLTHQIQETIKQHQQFGVLLEVALAELRESEYSGDVVETKRLILQEIQKFLRGHRNLGDTLDQAYQSLHRIADDSRKLSDELSRVRRLSLTDELTALPNRRAFQRRLEDEVARVNRYGSSLALAMIDLDSFKRINDENGHPAGDQVLVAYAGKVLSIFRHHDMVARHGGEEFAVLLPNTDLGGVLRALHKVKERAAKLTIQLDDATVNAPTFSAGVAIYHPGETADSFVSRADSALYQAKNLGRNRVEVAYEDRAEEQRYGEIKN